MTDYAFVSNDDDQSENNNDQQTLDSGMDWSLGSHSTAATEEKDSLLGSIGETLDALDESVDEETVQVLEDARETVESTSVSDFECPHPDCGLGHGHADGKHDIRDSPNSSGIPGFNIEASFAEQMEFVPYCHCGANEAAMLVKFFPYIDVPMFKDQHQFEGVLEADPAALNAAFRYYDQGKTISQACGLVAADMGRQEAAILPLGIREDMELFFQRRQQIESQAGGAPIGQETRAVINESFENLNELTEMDHDEAI